MCHFTEHFDHKCALIPFPAMGHRSEVRGIRLEDDALQGDTGQDFGQCALLVGQHTAYTEHKAWELEKLLRLLHRTAETMEDAGEFLMAILLHGRNKLSVCGTGMNDERQTMPDSPLYLYAESVFLLADSRLVPIKVEPHLAYSNVGMMGFFQKLLHICKHLPVGGRGNVLGMQPEHGIAIIGMTAAKVEHRPDAGGIDVGQEDFLDTSLTRTQHDVLAVSIELGFVDMAVRINHAVSQL